MDYVKAGDTIQHHPAATGPPHLHAFNLDDSLHINTIDIAALFAVSKSTVPLPLPESGPESASVRVLLPMSQRGYLFHLYGPFWH